jgi:hypothetical protein
MLHKLGAIGAPWDVIPITPHISPLHKVIHWRGQWYPPLSLVLNSTRM